MKGNLLEAYAKRLNIAEAFYAGRHNGEKLSDQKKLVTAVCLNNVNRFLTEAFSNSEGTQMSNMGQYKKFCLSLTNLAVPDLIIYDLMRVEPMTSMSGYVTYLEITKGSNKGESKQGDLINNPFQYGKTDVNYTGNFVAETTKAVQDDTKVVAHLAWSPVMVTAEGKLANGGKIVKVADGSEITDYTVTKDGLVTITRGAEAEDDIKVAYVYDNIYIPQNDLPIITAQMKPLALAAKARRVAIYYSQMAAFQAKTDYGFDLSDTLATQAVGELNREIDVEGVDLLVTSAESDESLVWSKTQPFGVNLRDHYASFLNQIEIAKAKVYKRTKKYAPTFMIVAADILPVLKLAGLESASTAKINGPYFAGTISGLKVFVSPDIEDGNYVIGVNNNELQATAGIFAPYMPIVPTQLLGYADGAMSQGWSTLYDMKILNPLLLIAGRVTA